MNVEKLEQKCEQSCSSLNQIQHKNSQLTFSDQQNKNVQAQLLNQEKFQKLIISQGFNSAFDFYQEIMKNQVKNAIDQDFKQKLVLFLIQLASKCQQQKQTQTALKILQEILLNDVSQLQKTQNADKNKNILRRVTILEKMGNIFDKKNQYTKALKCHIQNYQLKEKLYGKQSEKCIECLTKIATTYYQMQQYEKAAQILLIVKDFRKEQQKQYHKIDYVRALISVANTYLKVQSWENSLKYYLEAKQDYQRYHQKQQKNLFLDILFKLGQIHRKTQKYQQALQFYFQALQFSKKIQKKDQQIIKDSIILNNIGYIYDKMKDYKKAQQYYLKCLQISKNSQLQRGQNFQNQAEYLHNLGCTYANMKKYEDALHFLNQSLDIKIKYFGQYHPSYIMTKTSKDQILAIYGFQTNIETNSTQNQISINDEFSQSNQTALITDQSYISYSQTSQKTQQLQNISFGWRDTSLSAKKNSIKILKSDFNNNPKDFKCLSQIITLLRQFSSIKVEKEQKLFQTQQSVLVGANQQTILNFNIFFKQLQFKDKIKLILDLLDCFQKITTTNELYEIDKTIKLPYQNKFSILLFFQPFKYQFDQKLSNLTLILKQFPYFLLKIMLVIDFQNKNKKIQDIIDWHFNFKQRSIDQFSMEFIESKVKYFLFSTELKIRQNNEIILLLIKFYLTSVKVNTNVNAKVSGQVQKLNRQQQQCKKENKDQKQLFKIGKQLKKVLINYQQTLQKQTQQNKDKNFIQQNTIMEWFDANKKINCQGQYECDDISSISQIQSFLLNQKQRIANKIRQNEPIYGKFIAIKDGVIQLQKTYGHFDVYSFQKYSKFYTNIESLILCGHNFGKQGFKILNNIPFVKLKKYQIWRNNIQTFESSGLQKLKDLVFFCATFNPLSIDSVQYLKKHIWPQLKQLRIQFIDGNISWPVMINQCILFSFPNIKRLRVGQTFNHQKQIINQETRKIIQSLEQKGIILL